LEIKTIDILLKIEKIETIEKIEITGEETEMVEMVEMVELIELIEISKLEDLSPYNHHSYLLDNNCHQYTYAWTILTHIYRTIITYKYHSKK